MRNLLRITAACLAVLLSSVFFPAIAGNLNTTVVASSEYGSTSDYPFPLSWNMGASQSLYPASVLDQAIPDDNYTIKQLVYPLKSVPTSGKITVSVYLTMTDAGYLAAPLAESDFICVTQNLEIDCSSIADNSLVIPVAAPFEMQRGKSLVIGMYVTAEEENAPDPAMEFEDCQFDGIYDTLTWYNYSKPTSVSLEGALFSNTEEYKVPGLALAYETGGGGDTPATEEAVIISSEYDSTSDYPFPLSWNQGASQSLYPASALDQAISADNYTIKQLVYPLKSVPTSGKITASVYLTMSDADYLAAPLAESDFICVTPNLEIDCASIADNTLRIPVATPFEMQRGKSLVIGMYVTAEEESAPNASLEFEDCQFDGIYDTLTWYNYSKPTSVSLEGALFGNSNEYKVPGLILVYGTGQGGDTPVVEKDLAAVSVMAPEGDIYVGYPYYFNVTVENRGNSNAESFTVELFNTEDGTVLATVESTDILYQYMSQRISLEVTFDAPGNYSIAARVAMVGDECVDNDVCDPIEVNVEKLPYKAISLAVDPEPEAGEEVTFTVTVGNEGSEVLEDYTVNLYLVREGFADKLIATTNEVPAIEVNSTAGVTFDYTFALAGSYVFKGEVVKGEGLPSCTPQLNIDITLDKLSPVITEQIPEWDNETHQFMGYAISRNSVNSASQLMYPASYFGEHQNAYQIQSIAFTVVKEDYQVDPVEMKISLAQTDRENGYTRRDKETLVSEDDFTLVYNGVFSTVVSNEPQTVTLDLQKLFTLENGKGLVINIETVAAGNSKYYLDLAASQTEENYVAYTRTSDGGNEDPLDSYTIYDGTMNVTNMLPCITLGYALEPLAAMIDVEATSIELTSGEVKAGEPATFKVSFVNAGTVDIEEYTIELLDEDLNVLQSYEGTEYVAVGEATSQKVKYTFTEGGEQKVSARVVVEGDVDPLNDTTPAIEVDVIGSITSVDTLAANGLFKYEPATSSIRVNDGQGVLTVYDISGRLVKTYNVEGASAIRLDITDGIYLVKFNGRTLKIRK